MNTDRKERYINMLEPFETLGTWWIPGSDDRYTGTLRYDPQRSILELEIIGELVPLQSGPIGFQEIKIINGVTVGRQLITLYNNLYHLVSIGAPGHMINRAIPQFVFIGYIFESDEQIVFNKLDYIPNHAEVFLGETCIKPEFSIDDNQISSYSLFYVQPEPIKFEFGGYGIKTILRATSLPTSGNPIIIPIEGNFSIESSQDIKHTVFLDEAVSSLHTFLELINDGRLEFKRISLAVISNDEGRTTMVDLLWDQGLAYPLSKIPIQHSLMFTVYGIKDEIQTIMRKWHETRKKFKPAHNLFFTVLRMRKELTVENCFLNLCHVLEAYHRIKNNDTYMPPAEYSNILDDIVKTVPDKHKKHIKQRLLYGNELGLRGRLKQIYDILPGKIQDRIGKKKNFCEKVVNTRNYLTHYDESIKESALSTEEMMKFPVILIAICKALFLLEAGISSEIIDDKPENFYIPEAHSFGDD